MATNDHSSKNWLDKLIHVISGHEEPNNREQLIDVLEDAKERQLVNADALQMIKGSMAISEQTVEDIMIPRSQMVVIEAEKPLPELLSTIIESGHSRFPVIGAHKDEIKGLLLAKDLLKHYVHHEDQAFKLNDCLRPVVTVPESKRLDILLKDFRSNRQHLALVVDEYGNLSGLVTIEDVLELIVGDIEDEHDLEDDTTKHIIKDKDNTFLVDALTTIEDFNDHFGSELSDAEFDTIGGIVTNQFGHLPKINETTAIQNFNFIVTKADNRRILQLRVNQNN